MDTSIADQTTPEDDETPSVTDRAKRLFTRHRKSIISGAALVIAAGAYAILAKGQEDAADETEDPAASPEPIASDQKRRSPDRHEVVSHQRRTRDGYITVRSYERGNSAA
ncbi:hypothetical protein [Yinghuangia soli]|uniref:Uncharacterized protein n=1 Tax=Yinghuangia soli TaxID=2908204 RepID=A0AA41U5I1_9ACTN|nr:hypothetical protein [Yinghuangia soli]MCF2534061.1 hypothetical protein [Yinghuangia soli]